MSVLCIGGICIPYSVIWPFVLIFLKQIWDFVTGGKKENKLAAGVSGDSSPDKKPLGSFKLKEVMLFQFKSFSGYVTGR